jgi:predicted ATP-grasp superfamily ATP-dependent carboligase
MSHLAPELGRALVLDANQRSALAVTRSLGRRGIHVVAADETARTLAGSSRYCRERIVCPSPRTAPEAFLTALGEETRRRAIAVVVPGGDVTTQLVLEHRSELGGVAVAGPSLQAFEHLTDKWRLYELTRELNVPAPRTHLVASRADVRPALDAVGLPAVAKARRSKLLIGGRWVDTSVELVRSAAEVERVLESREWARRNGLLLQQHVAGQGYGLFALYEHGRPGVFFAHRRLREKPPSGGVSVLSESVAIDPKLRFIGERLLDVVGWHGVAMLEFKVAADGSPYLLEVNGRFWGSLQLAVDAGVDFPWLAYQLAIGQSVETAEGYAVGCRNRWLLGDLDHLYLRWREPIGPLARAKALWRFLRPAGARTRHEIDRWSDLGPAWHELKAYIRGSS